MVPPNEIAPLVDYMLICLRTGIYFLSVFVSVERLKKKLNFLVHKKDTQLKNTDGEGRSPL